MVYGDFSATDLFANALFWFSNIMNKYYQLSLLVFYNNVVTKKNAFGNQNLFILSAKNARGWKDRDYHWDRSHFETIRNLYLYFGTIVHTKRASHYFNRTSDFYQVSSPGQVTEKKIWWALVYRKHSVRLSVHDTCKCNSSLTNELILMKLYTVL